MFSILFYLPYLYAKLLSFIYTIHFIQTRPKFLFSFTFNHMYIGI